MKRPLVKVVLSILVIALGYEAMVTAFHLLNLPSDRSVYGGVAILLALFVTLYTVLRWIWRQGK